MANHVPTLETSRRLLVYGFPQDTYFSYWELPNGEREVWDRTMESEYENGTQVRLCAAPILTEILEALKQFADREWSNGWEKSYKLQFFWDGIDSDWNVRFWNTDMDDGLQHPDSFAPIITYGHAVAIDDNPAEAAALLWLELKSTGQL